MSKQMFQTDRFLQQVFSRLNGAHQDGWACGWHREDWWRPARHHVVSNKIEHPAILKVLHFLSQYGLKYDLVGVLSNGIVSVEEIEKAILPETSLISLMLANNEIGTIQPIKDVVEIAKKYNVLVHTDAVQCLGKMEVNVLDLGVDFLSLSAHKF